MPESALTQGLPEQISARAALAGVAIAPAELDRLERYLRLLRHWNRTINLTALPLETPSDSAIDRLLIEPLCAARFVEEGAVVWFDLGSGCGSPAIPLKIARPESRLTMVEARSRKAAFLREAVRTLELTESQVLTGRAEEVAPINMADSVTSRGVRLDKALAATVSALLRPGGRFVVFGRGRHPWLVKHGFSLAAEQPLPASGTLQIFEKSG